LPITAEKVLAGIIDTRGRKSEVGSRKEGARSRDQSAKSKEQKQRNWQMSCG